ncbi:thiolase family protein [Aliibacillus thermotolerans]|uniref:acetyl-CoA C-acetyltransferase n=1 Tax=Aliibacillus thermotolerans TaxID=1834418 RepID=A0ABW0U4J6_9BACI|nr:thiolase family protein [Aliibacillus thermotolerans]MDA3130897.1 acetyl-CoA C-acyltransferase [Aliibacillus thermotolerans]
MRNVVIVSGKRTPIGRFNGVFKDKTAVELGTIALKGALEAINLDPQHIEEVIGGHVYQAGCKGNTARQVAIHAGCPVETVAVTINQQCPSSLRATDMLAGEIMLGKIDAGAVVGMESMTNVPYLLPKARQGYRMGDAKVVDGLLHDALLDAFHGYHMGVTAENLVEKYEISREAQDELALSSQKRAVAAMEKGIFKEEIVPVEVKQRRETVVIEEDEGPNPNTTADSLKGLRPVFKEGGTVTAGNASTLNDGAAALILMAEEKAEALGLEPLARIVGSSSAAVDPKVMGIGVVPAVKKALAASNLTKEEIDYWEINEAFAAQFLAVNQELNIDLDKVNRYGSGISLGHPVGATGARILVTLIHELQKSKEKYGCASLCAGGGPGAALVVENVNI